jgi:hypothetical protein
MDILVIEFRSPFFVRPDRTEEAERADEAEKSTVTQSEYIVTRSH